MEVVAERCPLHAQAVAARVWVPATVALFGRLRRVAEPPDRALKVLLQNLDALFLRREYVVH